MKLNLHHFRHLSATDWRVLTAVEMGTKNHEVVPTSLIIQLSGVKTGGSGVHKCISTLAKANLISRERNMKYDGYRLTYGGYDYLALRSHLKSGRIVHVGSQMGVGKESDIYLITSPATLTSDTTQQQQQQQQQPTTLTPSTNPNSTPPSQPTNQQPQHADLAQTILKIHRLGRTSFRTIKNNRAYHGSRSGISWQYLSRLSASKEFAAMTALHEAGFPTPRPVGWNRHTVVMTLVPGLPLRTVPLEVFGEVDTSASEEVQTKQKQLRDQKLAALFGRCVELALRLAEVGLIHGDLNEFNLLIENVPDHDAQKDPQTAQQEEEMVPHLIDFPQITSMGHPNAQTYFDRDIQGIKSFFRKRYHFEVDSDGPTYKEAVERLTKAEKVAAESTGTEGSHRLDVKIEAMGFSRKGKQARELEEYYVESAVRPEETEQEEGEGEEGEEVSSYLDDNDNVTANDNTAENGETQQTKAVEPQKGDEAFTALTTRDHNQDNTDIQDLWSEIRELSLDSAKPSDRVNEVKTSIRTQKSAKAAAGWSI